MQIRQLQSIWQQKFPIKEESQRAPRWEVRPSTEGRLQWAWQHWPGRAPAWADGRGQALGLALKKLCLTWPAMASRPWETFQVPICLS